MKGVMVPRRSWTSPGGIGGLLFPKTVRTAPGQRLSLLLNRIRPRIQTWMSIKISSGYRRTRWSPSLCPRGQTWSTTIPFFLLCYTIFSIRFSFSKKKSIMVSPCYVNYAEEMGGIWSPNRFKNNLQGTGLPPRVGSFTLQRHLIKWLVQFASCS